MAISETTLCDLIVFFIRTYIVVFQGGTVNNLKISIYSLYFPIISHVKAFYNGYEPHLQLISSRFYRRRAGREREVSAFRDGTDGQHEYSCDENYLRSQSRILMTHLSYFFFHIIRKRKKYSMPLNLKEYNELRMSIIKKISEDASNKKEDKKKQRVFLKMYKQAHKFLKEQNGYG